MGRGFRLLIAGIITLVLIPLALAFFYEGWAKQNLPPTVATILTSSVTPGLVALVGLVLLFIVATWPHVLRGGQTPPASGVPVPPQQQPPGTPPGGGFVGNNYGTVNIYPGVPAPTTIHEVPGGVTTTEERENATATPADLTEPQQGTLEQP